VAETRTRTGGRPGISTPAPAAHSQLPEVLGPGDPNHVAAYLDAPIAEIKAHWPEDAVQVSVDGRKGWLLSDHDKIDQVDRGAAGVRLLGGFDLFLQCKDRDLIVPDKSRHKQLWPVLGRPGAVLSGLELIGTWRPKAAGGTFTLRLDLWETNTKAVRERIEAEAERLAAHRGLTLAGIEQD
jgi:hypothetical protein